jgi:hypothetical protein
MSDIASQHRKKRRQPLAFEQSHVAAFPTTVFVNDDEFESASASGEPPPASTIVAKPTTADSPAPTSESSSLSSSPPLSHNVDGSVVERQSRISRISHVDDSTITGVTFSSEGGEAEFVEADPARCHRTYFGKRTCTVMYMSNFKLLFCAVHFLQD